MAISNYSMREELEKSFREANLPYQADLMAMHLAEIEEETANFLDQLTAFRVYARHQDPVVAQETLVEISLSLQHMAGHIQAATPILDHELGIDEDQADEEDSPTQ